MAETGVSRFSKTTQSGGRTQCKRNRVLLLEKRMWGIRTSLYQNMNFHCLLKDSVRFVNSDHWTDQAHTCINIKKQGVYLKGVVQNKTAWKGYSVTGRALVMPDRGAL